jgi:hypothetical protein
MNQVPLNAFTIPAIHNLMKMGQGKKIEKERNRGKGAHEM